MERNKNKIRRMAAVMFLTLTRNSQALLFHVHPGSSKTSVTTFSPTLNSSEHLDYADLSS